LPQAFRHCADAAEPSRLEEMALCPACRVFGWVRDAQGKRLEANPDRIDAVAGHVRFTHGLLEGKWGDSPARCAAVVTLPILGSPQPTTTEFYLEPLPGYEKDEKAKRWPPVLQRIQAPLYRQTEAHLRGRKFYRRRSQTIPASRKLAAGGLTRAIKGEPPEKPLDAKERFDTQNQTVHLLPPGLSFRFRIAFDNLRPEELGALLVAVTLQAPDRWNAPAAGTPAAMFHMLGHGKPLGMGCCSITIERLHLDSFDPADPNHRYARVPIFSTPLSGGGAATAGDPAPVVAIQEYVERFDQSWQAAEGRRPDLERVRQELVEMLSRLDPGEPVHYPPSWEGGRPRHYENFRWFVANRKPGGAHAALPTPEDERKSEQRLPLDSSRP
jgi:CRISPR-associated protein (TIGR03986 family)